MRSLRTYFSMLTTLLIGSLGVTRRFRKRKQKINLFFYLLGIAEFAVNFALVTDGKPVTRTKYYGLRDDGSIIPVLLIVFIYDSN